MVSRSRISPAIKAPGAAKRNAVRNDKDAAAVAA
jgi:hypothetical protein